MRPTRLDLPPSCPAKAQRLAQVPAPRATAGFTLVEMLLAATLGAGLIVGTATSAGMFGRQVEVIREQLDDSKERALSAIGAELRYSWSAETPTNRWLDLYDPDGSTGVLIEGLRTANFNSDTITRYREGKPVSHGAAIFGANAPSGAVGFATMAFRRDAVLTAEKRRSRPSPFQRPIERFRKDQASTHSPDRTDIAD